VQDAIQILVLWHTAESYRACFESIVVIIKEFGAKANLEISLLAKVGRIAFIGKGAVAMTLQRLRLQC